MMDFFQTRQQKVKKTPASKIAHTLERQAGMAETVIGLIKVHEDGLSTVSSICF